MATTAGSNRAVNAATHPHREAHPGRYVKPVHLGIRPGLIVALYSRAEADLGAKSDKRTRPRSAKGRLLKAASDPLRTLSRSSGECSASSPISANDR